MFYEVCYSTKVQDPTLSYSSAVPTLEVCILLLLRAGNEMHKGTVTSSGTIFMKISQIGSKFIRGTDT
jgi:hypothetical protein